MAMNSVEIGATGNDIASVCSTPVRGGGSLARKQHLIETALDEHTRFSPDCPDALREAIRYSLLHPGKRLRPMLALLAAEACGGKAEDALPAACAVEMIHTYSLIHDDLPSMDNDDSRRGRPTCHKKFGEAIAILAGDAILALAFEVIAKHVQPPATAAACCATLAHAAGATALVGGQADDISQHAASGTREMLEAIHNRKTGALFQASLRLGGLVAGASDAQLDALQKFGQDLGLAFQITDDLLDHEEDVGPTRGKVKKGGDVGKLTFPNLIGFEQSQSEVERLVNSACEALAPLGPSARSLRALAKFVSDRL